MTPLRVAILDAISSDWATPRDLAQHIEGYEQRSIRTELWRMSADGVLQKRVEACPGERPFARAYFRLSGGFSNGTDLPRETINAPGRCP
jgi:hypothetical protein